MRPYFQTHLVAGLVFWATAIGWIVLEARQGAKTRAEATDSDRGSRQLIRATLFGAWLVSFVVTADFPALAIRGDRALFFVVAMGTMWAGMALRFWSFHTLGRYFTFTVMTSTDQQVVTSGPYRWLRHPGYAGGTLATIGLGLAFGNWAALAVMTVVPLIGVVNRIRVEEAALLGTLGERYATYAGGRKRLVPYLW
ncbi:MAG TPA: isoprenylcysteine carboxylmethyltransferase family protein [Acidimicrobiales bacterium]|nr:isoprenylcysteine carboxylmethyltransferase family protein [Acidimicrobiales bacterium]